MYIITLDMNTFWFGWSYWWPLSLALAWSQAFSINTPFKKQLQPSVIGSTRFCKRSTGRSKSWSWGFIDQTMNCSFASCMIWLQAIMNWLRHELRCGAWYALRGERGFISNLLPLGNISKFCETELYRFWIAKISSLPSANISTKGSIFMANAAKFVSSLFLPSPLRREKRKIHRYKSLTGFSICALRSICAIALDMPCGARGDLYRTCCR